MHVFDHPVELLLQGLGGQGGQDLDAQLAVIASRLERERRKPGPESEGRFSAALQALLALPPEYAPESKVRTLALIAAYYQDTAHPEMSLRPAEAAVQCAARLGDALWCSKTYKLLGVSRAQLGDFPGAVIAFTEAVAMARSAGSSVEEAAAWNNLGVTYLSASHFGDAAMMFERAVAVAGDNPAAAKARRLALANLALTALQSGDIAKGIRTVQTALAAVTEPATANDYLHLINVESHYARLLLEINLIDEARAHAEKIRRYAAQCPLDIAQMNASLAQGLVEVVSQRCDIGFSRLQGALQLARQRLPYSLPDVLATMTRAYQMAGQPDAALVYWRELERLKQDAATMAVRAKLLYVSSEARAMDESARKTSLERGSELRAELRLHDSVRANIALLEQQAVAAELHDDTTGEHCYRVGRLASLLAREYKVEDDVCFLIDLSARTHDIGKLGVPDAIILKPGKLTADERAIMERHTTIGAELLANAKIPQLYVAEEIARHHHERWDGTGYPFRLKGSNIPLAARITALADVYDALTHVRPYKRAWSMDEALCEIVALRGKHFDPELTDLFVQLVPRLQREHGDLDAFLGAAARGNEFVAKRAALARELKGEDGAGLRLDDSRR